MIFTQQVDNIGQGKTLLGCNKFSTQDIHKNVAVQPLHTNSCLVLGSYMPHSHSIRKRARSPEVAQYTLKKVL